MLKGTMKKLLGVAAAAVMTLAMAAVGHAEETIELNVAYMPNYASLWSVLTGIDQGFFAEEGLEINLAAALTSLISDTARTNSALRGRQRFSHRVLFTVQTGSSCFRPQRLLLWMILQI